MMNAAQQQAVTTRAPEVLVAAGAGSGKTRVLTERYVDLLLNGDCTVEQILTLTFTRKAALEMRTRIAGLLAAHGKVAERRRLPRAPIGTIHGYCERLLREYALAAGIDPNFRLLDEPESRTLQEKTLDLLFEEIWSGARDEREAVGRLLLDFPQGGRARQSSMNLRDALLGVFRHARTRGLSLATLTPALPGDLGIPARALVDAVLVLLSLSGTAEWQARLAALRPDAETLTQLLATCQREEGFSWEAHDRVAELTARLRPNGGPRPLAKEARDAITDATTRWQEAYLDRAARPYLMAFATLLSRLDTVYRQQKDLQGLLDFEDLLLITRDLLASEETVERPFRQVMVDEFQDTNPLQFEIIRALQGDGQLFVVGDVKQAIYRFIGSEVGVFLAQEARIASQGTDSLRIPMSTNYRTRPEVLGPLNALFARLWGSDAEPPQVADFRFEALEAGQAFLPISQPAIEIACWPGGGEPAEALRDREAAWIARRIQQLTGQLGEAPLSITVAPATADGLPTARPAQYGDVMVLFRASFDIPRYEHAFRAASVPYYVVSGRGFYQSREVQDVLYFLRVLDNPLDDFALAVVLRSPLVGVSDDTLYWLSRDWTCWEAGLPYPGDPRTDATFGRLWDNVVRADSLTVILQEDRDALARLRTDMQALQAELPAGQPLDLIDLLLACTGYADSLLAMEGGEQRFANVQKLREVAAEFQARGIFDLADFQRYLAQLAEIAPREASAPLDVEGSNIVRLMTIHAAKGLEAPIVFLADGGREPQKMQELFLHSPVDGLVCKVPTPEGEWANPGAYRQVLAQNTHAERREAERLLYVAMTRAREHLVCCGFAELPLPDQPTSYLGILLGLLDQTTPITDDMAVPLTYAGMTNPVRLWSPASLAAVEALQPPPQPPTLWEAHREAILAGEPLPLVQDAEMVERYTRLVHRLRPLPAARRTTPLRVGVHRVLGYTTCPRQFWYRHVLDWQGERPVAGGAVDEELSDHHAHVDGTAFGTLVHRVMQLVDLRTPLTAQLPALLPGITTEGLLVSDGDWRDLGDYLARFAGTPAYLRLTRAEEVYRELRFLTEEGGIYVPGILDVLAREGDDWWILDYKTGHPSANHMRQVGLYALGVFHTLGVVPVRTTLVYLDAEPARMIRQEPVTAGLLDHARQLIRRAGEGIRRGDYQPTPGPSCTSCPYAGACPDALDRLSGVSACS